MCVCCMYVCISLYLRTYVRTQLIHYITQHCMYRTPVTGGYVYVYVLFFVKKKITLAHARACGWVGVCFLFPPPPNTLNGNIFSQTPPACCQGGIGGGGGGKKRSTWFTAKHAHIHIYTPTYTHTENMYVDTYPACYQGRRDARRQGKGD